MLLLDSHTVLWVLDDNPRLGAEARRTISGATRVHVSVATVWELTIKSMLGKLSAPSGLSARLVEQGLSLLDITAEDAEGVRDFPELVRHDPFDRLLVSQAKRTETRLVTADDVLLDLRQDFIVDARK